MRERVVALGLGHRVRFENHRPDVRALLDASDVLVLPSLADAQPRVLIEAMFAGLPVVSTFVGGIPDLVRHGETGILVAPGDAAALAAAMARVADSEALRRAFGAAGRARAESEFRPERTAARYVAVYRALAAGESIEKLALSFN
jgi:glycosyltransferase involved in cell wall biosynthesis